MASAAAVAVTPASNKVCGLSGDVIDTSKAAVLPMTQLGISISAGRVLLWLGVRLLPTSTHTPMWAWRLSSGLFLMPMCVLKLAQFYITLAVTSVSFFQLTQSI